jgi:hypothetical protein
MVLAKEEFSPPKGENLTYFGRGILPKFDSKLDCAKSLQMPGEVILFYFRFFPVISVCGGNRQK